MILTIVLPAVIMGVDSICHQNSKCKMIKISQAISIESYSCPDRLMSHFMDSFLKVCFNYDSPFIHHFKKIKDLFNCKITHQLLNFFELLWI